MTDLANISDDELLASLPRGIRNRNPGNIEDGDFARSLPGYQGGDGRFAIFDTMDNGRAAQARLLGSYGKRGLNTVEGVVNRWAPKTENDTGAYAKFVSQRLGVDPRAPLNMNDPRTLSAMADAMAEHENGAPVAPADLSGVSDEELLASLGKAVPKAKPPPLAVAAKVMPKAAAPSRAQEAASGFLQPFRDLGDMVTARQETLRQRAAAPPIPSLTGLAKGLIGDTADTAQMLGGILNLGAAPLMAAIRPTASKFVDTFGGPTLAPRVSLSNGKVSTSAPRKLTGGEAKRNVEQTMLTAASAARPAAPRPDAAPKPMSLTEVEQLDRANWKAVDASGYRFPQKDLQGAAADIKQIVADADPDLYPESAKIAAKAERMANRGQLSPGQANRLRSQVGEKLLQPGSTEVSVGNEIKARIDALIDSANNPDLAKARESYMRLSKMKEVSNRIDSAELRAESTYAGGNQANAVRQNLRPTIDPKSPQRIRNWTPDEARAVRGVVRGSPVANAARVTGKVLDPRGLLGAAVQTMFGIPTGGLSTISIPVGMFGSAYSNHSTRKAAQNLLDLISIGGSLPATPAPSVVGPFAPLTGPSRLVGGGAVALPLVQTLAEPRRTKAPAKAATKGQRK